MIFPPFGNELLSPSKYIILKGNPINYPLKKKDIYDYNPRCFVSSGLMFDEIIMKMIRNKALEYHKEGFDNCFTNIENKKVYMYRGSLQYFYWKKGTH